MSTLSTITRLLFLVLLVGLVFLIAGISQVTGHLTDTAVVLAPAQVSTSISDQTATVSL
jgi:hypothetical protein